MAENSKIAWTDHTFNPWIGCTKVSEGCKFCYAEHDTFARRERSHGRELWGPLAERHRTSESYWKKPLKEWNKKQWQECMICGWRGPISETHVDCPMCDGENLQPTRQRVFCASMADVFETNVKIADWRNDLFKLIEQTQNLDWLLLTKRPENIIGNVWSSGTFLSLPDNVWIGTSVENQERANERIPELLKVEAKIHFLSVEPMLAPLSLRDIPPFAENGGKGIVDCVDWVICGGESGPKARAMNVDWARSLRDQCKAAGVPFFMKQLGGHPDKRDKLEDLPEDLRIREFPRTYREELRSIWTAHSH